MRSFAVRVLCTTKSPPASRGKFLSDTRPSSAGVPAPRAAPVRVALAEARSRVVPDPPVNSGNRERTLFHTCASLLAEASAQGGDGLARESDLEDWLRTSYARAYRTACLILRNPADAEEVVQEAFLRVWRFRDAMPDADRRDGWLYRVVVNACCSRVRADRVRPIGVRGDDALE